MEPIDKSNRKSVAVTTANLREFTRLFPEAVRESKISLEVLQECLGSNMSENGEPLFGLQWHGKREARRVALAPTSATLRPVRDESVDWDNSGNVFIEGDNLEVLKLLLNAYGSRVRVIYIDPPYNTGNDFVYRDQFAEGLEAYLRYTGQLDDDGKRITSAVDESGGRHAKWLSMMYPRLYLARRLLRQDGVILISIDENENYHLRSICNEIFEESNFVAELIWHTAGGSQAGHFPSSHETVLVYAKSKDHLPYFSTSDEGVIRERAYKRASKGNPESDITFPKGSITFEGSDAEFDDVLGEAEKQTVTRGKLRFSNGVLAEDVTIRAAWSMKDQVLSWLSGEETFDTKGQPVVRFYFNSKGRLHYEKTRTTTHPGTMLGKPQKVGTTKSGSKELEDILGARVLEFPKPTTLIQFLLKVVSEPDDLILDFFAGSGTTAHATMALNSADGGTRRFLLVQLPEPCPEGSTAKQNGYHTIADIGKERIRRVATKFAEANGGIDADFGFRVFRLDATNVTTWAPSGDDIEQNLLHSVDHIVDGRGDEDLLYEVLIKRGVGLNVDVTRRVVGQYTILCANQGGVFACFSEAIDASGVDVIAEAIVSWWREQYAPSNSLIIFRDDAFDDEVVKANMNAVLTQYGFTDIRSM